MQINDSLQTQESDFFFKISQWCIYALAFLLPFWFLPGTVSPVDFNKILMVSIFVTLSFIFYLTHAILRGKISLSFHWIFALMVIIGVLWLASALLSQAGSAALWGIGAEQNSFLSMLVFLVMVWLVAMLFPDFQSFKNLLSFLVLGFSLFILLVLLSILGIGKLVGGLFADKTFNPIGSWNSVAVASGFFVIMLYPFVLGFKGFLKWITVSFFLLAVLIIGIVNFALAWVILGFFALIFLSYAIWKRKVTGAALLVTMFLLAISIFGFLLRDNLAHIVVSIFGVQSPVEVGVSHSATFGVLKNALKEDFFFGKGPTTFGYLWDLYKPKDVNQTIFWGLRFNSGSSYLLSILGEIGLLGWVFFVGFLISILYFALKVVSSHIDSEKRPFFLSIFFMTAFIFTAWALYPVGYTLAALGFLSAGLVLSLLRINGNIRVYEINLFGEGPLGFVSAFVIVILMIGGLFVFYIHGSRYVSEVVFAQGLTAFNTLGNIDAAEKKFISATSFYAKNDAYFRFLSQIYMIRAQLLLQDKETPKELLGSKFKDFLDKAVNAAQTAIIVQPLDSNNYRSLGKIYEFLTSLNTAGSADAALSQYEAALKRAPQNPLFYQDKATVYLSEAVSKKSNDFLKKAEGELLKAVDLKPDYADAHFLLAQIYDAEGNSEEAIRRGEAAALLSQSDIGTLFQLGLLYYKNNRLSDAEVLLNRIVSINSNYSNARYFLGLIYDRTNRKDMALAEFQKIASLNPDNIEIKKIISNLEAGKSALLGISPPGPSPEKRKTPPVKDINEKSSLETKGK